MADVAGVLKKLFPFLSVAATAGGPIGVMAANALGTALGVQNPKPGDISQMLTAAGATPDQLKAAQDAERNFALQMQQLGFQNAQQLEEIAAGDRANARAREIAVKDKIPAILGITITLGFFGLLASMMKWAPPNQNQDLLDIMLGSLGTAWVAVVTYYFGSSAGSAKKDEILHNMSTK